MAETDEYINPIRFMRQEMGLTTKDLAAKLGASQRQLQHQEQTPRAGQRLIWVLAVRYLYREHLRLQAQGVE